jgi:omega-amidase
MSTLTITTIQTALHWEDKTANLQMLEEKIRGIKGKTVQWMKRIAAEMRIILTGSVIIKEPAPFALEGAVSEVYYNRLVWVLPNGQYGVYDKRHRFGFAGEDEHYTAGTKRLIASVKGWKINLLVCYDLRFPVWARQVNKGNGGEAEYDVLIYVANWPERRSHSWKTLLLARAIENQCYVVGVNRVGNDGNNIHHSGDSMIIDPLGEVLYTKKDEEDVFTITLEKSHLQTIREKLPFLKDADEFQIITDSE